MQNLKSGKAASFGWFLLVLSASICLFHIFISTNTAVSVMQSRVLHLFSLMFMWYFYKTQKSKDKGSKILFSGIAVLVLVLWIYYMTQTTRTMLMDKGI